MQTTALDREGAPRVARRAVAAECLRARSGPVCAESAELMTSEVVTNALRHSTGSLTFGVVAGQERVRVEVGDDERRGPTTPAGSQYAENGRGLLIVGALASGWGVNSAPVGKVVWFEVLAQP